jgi:hypothetical protein
MLAAAAFWLAAVTASLLSTSVPRTEASAVTCGEFLAWGTDPVVIPANCTAIVDTVSHFGAEGAIALAEALLSNPFVTSVHLDSNKIRDEGAIALAKMFETNHFITTVRLNKQPHR